MMDRDDLHKSSTGSRSLHNAESGGNGINPMLIAWLVILAVAAIFFFRNGKETELDFLFITTRNKTRWLVITCIALGVVLDRLFSVWWRRRRRERNER